MKRVVLTLPAPIREEPVNPATPCPPGPAANPACDVTPARLVTGLITERGIAEASETGLRRLFPEK